MDTRAIANELDHEIAALKAKAADYGARHKVIEKMRPGRRACASR